MLRERRQAGDPDVRRTRSGRPSAAGIGGAQAGRALWPVLAGLVLGLLVVVVLGTSGGSGGAAPPVVEPAPERPPLPVELPEGIDPSQVEILELPTPDVVDAPEDAAGDADVDDTGTLEIRVRWDDGAPAPDVGVLVVASSNARRRPRTARADGAGVARFPGVPAGSVSVYGDRGGTAHGDVVVDGTSVVDLELPHGPWVHGSVVDPDGAPFAGADVWLSTYGNHRDGQVVERSDEAGRFVLRSAGGGHYVGARAPGRWAPSDLVRVPETDAARVDVELGLVREGGAVVVTVLDREEQPVPDAEVVVGVPSGFRRARTETTGATTNLVPPLHAHTDEAGVASLDPVPPDETRLVVLADGFSPADEPVTVVDGGRVERTVVIGPEVALSGRTVALRDGEPVGVGGARVSVARPGVRHGDLLYTETTSAPDGRWSLRGVLTGRVVLEASHDEHGEAARDLDLEPGDARDDLVLPLDRGREIAGTIVDAHGVALEGWIVQVESRERHDGWRGEAESDATGAFAVTNCGAGRHRLVMYEPDWRSVVPVLSVDDVVPDGDPLRLVVPDDAVASAEIRFALVDGAGLPISGASLQLFSALGPTGVVEGDVPGTYRAAPLPPGTYSLRVWPGARPGLERSGLVVAARQVLDLGTLELADGGRVHVTVTRPPGGEEGGLWPAVTDAGGRWIGNLHETDDGWLSDALPPGEHLVAVRGEHVADALRPVTVRAGETTSVHLDLEASVLHVVQVEGLAEDPTVAAIEPGFMGLRTLLYEAEDLTGRPVVRRLEAYEAALAAGRPLQLVLQARPGDYRVRLSADGTVVAEGEVTLVADDAHAVTRLRASH